MSPTRSSAKAPATSSSATPSEGMSISSGRFLRQRTSSRRWPHSRRVLHMDRRGSGASDAVSLKAIPTWEELAEDIAGVLDATGSTVADLVGVNEVGPIAVLFAAMHPERVGSLILINTAARYIEAPDYPIGVAPAALDAIFDMLMSTWGSDAFAAATNPTRVDDREFIKAAARMNRASATPSTAAALMRYFLSSMDVRPFLPLVQSPTLVLQVTDSPFILLEHGQYLADHIPGATFVPMSGGDMTPPFGPNAASEIAEFLTGKRQSFEVDRVLTSVLFTDIVGSTETAASMGDQRWRTSLDGHDRLVREQLRQFRGREIKTTGDGFLASFDGPARAIRCARAIVETVEVLGIKIRAGLHTGECEVRGDDLGGLAVHIAARVGRDRRDPERSSSQAQSRTSSLDPTSHSLNEANISSRACPAPGSSSPYRHEETDLKGRCPLDSDAPLH